MCGIFLVKFGNFQYQNTHLNTFSAPYSLLSFWVSDGIHFTSFFYSHIFLRVFFFSENFPCYSDGVISIILSALIISTLLSNLILIPSIESFSFSMYFTSSFKISFIFLFISSIFFFLRFFIHFLRHSVFFHLFQVCL